MLRQSCAGREDRPPEDADAAACPAAGEEEDAASAAREEGSVGDDAGARSGGMRHLTARSERGPI